MLQPEALDTICRLFNDAMLVAGELLMDIQQHMQQQ